MVLRRERLLAGNLDGEPGQENLPGHALIPVLNLVSTSFPVDFGAFLLQPEQLNPVVHRHLTLLRLGNLRHKLAEPVKSAYPTSKTRHASDFRWGDAPVAPEPVTFPSGTRISNQDVVGDGLAYEARLSYLASLRFVGVLRFRFLGQSAVVFVRLRSGFGDTLPQHNGITPPDKCVAEDCGSPSVSWLNEATGDSGRSKSVILAWAWYHFQYLSLHIESTSVARRNIIRFEGPPA